MAATASSSSRHIIVIGAGVIGLSTAHYAMRLGHRVTILDRGLASAEGCSFGNAGMVVPSHFVPLAAPGMVALGLKWMWNPESPLYIQPRLNLEQEKPIGINLGRPPGFRERLASLILKESLIDKSLARLFQESNSPLLTVLIG